MEQLLGEFKTINSAANAKLDSIEEQYSQDDTGIVDTGATSGVAAPKDVEQMDLIEYWLVMKNKSSE